MGEVIELKSDKGQRCFIQRGERVKGHKRKVMAVLNAAAHPRGRERKCEWLEGESWAVSDSLIWFYYLFETWTRCWLADWLCLVAGRCLMGLMEFQCQSLISQLWWPADRSWWIAGAEGSPDSHAWLMNCEMRQTYKSCGQPRPGLTPLCHVLPSPGQLVWQWVPQCSYPSFTMTEVMWAAKLGTTETHCTALGLDLKSFNDRLRPSITMTFLFNAVLVEYKIK